MEKIREELAVPGERPEAPAGEARPSAGPLTPREIVAELDRYIIGQDDAKRSVAVALRNRWRRRQVPPDLRDEIAPKNIIMIGPTGVGKTEIARRLAKLAQAPFLKVEASKYTEVGYVGRDVESMIRDLVEIGVNLVRGEEQARVRVKAREMAEERILDILLPPAPREPAPARTGGEPVEPARRREGTREKLKHLLREGRLDDREVEVEVTRSVGPNIQVFSPQGVEDMGINFKEIFGHLFPKSKKTQRMKVPEAIEWLADEEEGKLIDMDSVAKQAIQRVEESGIVFVDELDKIAGREGGRGPEVSREGVQRDLLPIIEGSTVTTRYGPVRTDHILFVAAGAFHVAKPSDLIPELQGRFPIRVELAPLDRADFVRILKEPRNALIRQYGALLATEGIQLDFTQDAIDEIASLACHVNETTENIGARRLHTILEKLLESISFEAPDLEQREVTVDAAYVRERLSEIIKDQDLSRYIL